VNASSIVKAALHQLRTEKSAGKSAR
jgi:hypothetical protein